MGANISEKCAVLEAALRRARLGRVLAEVYQRAATDQPEEWPAVDEHVRHALEAEEAAVQECESHRKACARCGAATGDSIEAGQPFSVGGRAG